MADRKKPHSANLDGRISAAALAILWKIRETFPETPTDAEALQGELVRILSEQIECGECIDGWIPGEDGIERCDTCTRFEDDDAARAHVLDLARTLVATYGPDEPLEVVLSLALGEGAPDE